MIGISGKRPALPLVMGMAALLALAGCQSQTTSSGQMTAGTSTAASERLPLENAYWVFAEAAGQPVTMPAGASQEPSLRFDAQRMQLSGTGGCNRLFGPYTQKGQALQLQVATTRMYCQGADDTERRILQALNQTRQFQTDSQQLTLMDAQGKVVARLRAVWLK